jgi:hypothetical protein
VRCSVGLADQILAPCGALAESGVQNHPTLARVEIPRQYIFGAFLTAKTGWLLTRGGSEVLGKGRLPPSIPKRQAPEGGRGVLRVTAVMSLLAERRRQPAF